MKTERRFAEANQLAGVVREVFGTDRSIVDVDRLAGGTKRGCAEHTLVGPQGEPVLIDIEGLMYFDVEVEHCWMRMRFQEHYPVLLVPTLDPARMKYYQYTMHLDLVGGPMRIADGDFPNRDWMLEIADHHLVKALAYEI